MHLFETVLLATLGPARYAALWKGNGELDERGREDGGEPLQELLDYTNCDAASLTWQDASKLVVDGSRVQHHGRLGERLLHRA